MSFDISSEAQNIDIGWDILLFQNTNEASRYLCTICKQVSLNAVELNCNDSKDEHDELYCAGCLKTYLLKSNNKCPINKKHFNVSYNTNQYVRKKVNRLLVRCPNSDLNAANIEGNIVEETKNNNESGCKWEGQLLNLESHLKNQCVKKIIACNYNLVGCNFVGGNHDIESHKDKSVTQHLELLYKIVLEQKSAIHLLTQENMALKTEQMKNKYMIKMLELTRTGPALTRTDPAYISVAELFNRYPDSKPTLLVKICQKGIVYDKEMFYKDDHSQITDFCFAKVGDHSGCITLILSPNQIDWVADGDLVMLKDVVVKMMTNDDLDDNEYTIMMISIDKKKCICKWDVVLDDTLINCTNDISEERWELDLEEQENKVKTGGRRGRGGGRGRGRGRYRGGYRGGYRGRYRGRGRGNRGDVN
eukprot:119991_1